MSPKRIIIVLFLTGVFTWAPLAGAGETAFDFKDPKGVNSMNIALFSLLEPIMGTAQGISGTVMFDPEKPEKLHGTIIVAADQIRMANATMTRMLHSEEWLDIARFPSVTFTLKEVISVNKTSEPLYEARISGDFTLRGVTKPLKLPVTITYLPGKLRARTGKGEGDLLVLRTRFAIDRTQFGIKPDMGPEKVAHAIDIEVGIVGSALRD